MASVVERPKQLYEVTKERIVADYVAALRRDGGRLPPVRRLAQVYGVNVGTIGKALHELEQVGVLTRRVGAGTFVLPHRPASGLVGIFYGGAMLDGTAENCVYGVLDEEIQHLLGGRERGFRHYADMRLDRRRNRPLPELEEDIAAGKVNALLIPRAGHEEHAWLRDAGVPSVSFGNPFGRARVRYSTGMFGVRAVSWLRDQGCRRIAMVCGWGTADPHDAVLVAEMRDALGAVLGPDGWSIPVTPTPPGPRQVEMQGYRNFLAAWAESPRPDGVAVMTDVAALGVVRAMRELGLRDGRDLRLVTHGNVENPWPELVGHTQFRLSVREAARGMVDLLAEQEGGGPARDITLTYHLYTPETKEQDACDDISSP